MSHYIIMERDRLAAILAQAYRRRRQPKASWIAELDNQILTAGNANPGWMPYIAIHDDVFPGKKYPPRALRRSLDWTVFGIVDEEFHLAYAAIWGEEFAMGLRDERYDSLIAELIIQLRQPLRAQVRDEIAKMSGKALHEMATRSMRGKPSSPEVAHD